MNSVTQSMRSAAGFCSGSEVEWPAAVSGPLTGMRLAVKDLFALKGHTNSAGNPDWLITHVPAESTAESLAQLLSAGAEFVGFTHTDELAYSLEGNNEHFGSAENPKLPGHSCGGSSMGSAAAVAAHWAEIGLGTDTGGSIRVPASYCGLFGIRPSHGVVSTEGLIGLAPRFDTVGWFCHSSTELLKVGRVLAEKSESVASETLVFDPALLNLVDPYLQIPLEQALERVKPLFPNFEVIDLGIESEFTELHDVFRILQGRAIAEYHGEWIAQYQPKFSPAIQSRMDMAFRITDAEVAEAESIRKRFSEKLAAVLADNKTLFLPTTPTTAPMLKEDTTSLRPRLLKLTAIAGLTGSAQVHLPLLPQAKGTGVSHPYGFSLLQAGCNDSGLLALVDDVTKKWNEQTL